MHHFLCLEERTEFLQRIPIHEFISPAFFSFSLKVRLWNVQIPSAKPHIDFYAQRLEEPTFVTEITTSEKFQFHI